MEKGEQRLAVRSPTGAFRHENKFQFELRFKASRNYFTHFKASQSDMRVNLRNSDKTLATQKQKILACLLCRQS